MWQRSMLLTTIIWQLPYLYLYFLYENKSLQHFLSYDGKQMGTILVLEVQFFQRVWFFLKSKVQVRVWILDDAFFKQNESVLKQFLSDLISTNYNYSLITMWMIWKKSGTKNIYLPWNIYGKNLFKENV